MVGITGGTVVHCREDRWFKAHPIESRSLMEIKLARKELVISFLDDQTLGSSLERNFPCARNSTVVVFNLFIGAQLRGNIPVARGPLFTYLYRKIDSYCRSLHLCIFWKNSGLKATGLRDAT